MGFSEESYSEKACSEENFPEVSYPKKASSEKSFPEKIVFQNELERENSNDAEMHAQFQIEKQIKESFEDCINNFCEDGSEKIFAVSQEEILDEKDEKFISSTVNEKLDSHRD